MRTETHTSDWDIDWNYTMGFPENNGFEKLVSGSVTVKHQEDGIYYKSNGGNSYLQLQPVNLLTCNEGVFDVKINVLTMYTANNGFRLMLSNGNEGCQIQVNKNSLQYNKQNEFISLNSLNTNIDYKIKIEIINNKNKIYLNETLIYETEIKSNSYATSNRVMFQSGGEYLLKEIKFKKIS